MLQAHEAESTRLTTWNVIDGQQRLTTLQLLTDATCAILTEAGATRYASQLEGLTHNSVNFLEEGDSPLKVRHLNKDHDAYLEVMTAEPPVEHSDLKHHDSQIVQAHHYFATVVAQWLGVPGTDEFDFRAKELAQVLLNDLQLVTIELKAAGELAGDLRDAERPRHAADSGGPHPQLRVPAARSRRWGPEEGVPRGLALRVQVLDEGSQRWPVLHVPQFAVPQPVAGIPHWRGRQSTVDLLPVQVLRRARGREADGGPARRHRCTGRSVRGVDGGRSRAGWQPHPSRDGVLPDARLRSRAAQAAADLAA